MDSLNFTQLVKGPTRITDRTATLIDHVFTNKPENITEINIPSYALSDHFPVAITRKCSHNMVKKPFHNHITYRSVKNFSEVDFLTDLSNQNWSSLTAYDDPDECTDLFIKLFSSILQKHAPLKRKRVKKVTQPNWFNPDILQAIKQRNYYHKKQNVPQYKFMRRRVKEIVYRAKYDYFNDHINGHKQNPKQLWKSLRELSGLNSDTQTPCLNDENGNLISDPVITANLFNTHFSNIHQTVPVDKTIIYTPCDSFITTIENKLSNIKRFAIPFVSVEFVERQLKSLDTSKSTGVDNLNAKYLKISASVIAPILTHIFNCSFNSNKFPKSFKLAKVIPIYKKGDKHDKNNYRPISILPIISLILERHVCQHLKAYLENNKLFYHRQSGFRENHSCQTALIKLLDDWISAIDKNEIVGTLFLDLSKAFDLVNHDILLRKLSMYGLHNNAIDWFKSYLNSRIQKTFISGEQSTPREVVAGVPQGSVLGPILFLIYINDLPFVLSHSVADIFADDTTLSTQSKSFDVVVASLTNDLLHVDQWCQLNHMSINSDKSKVMFICSNNNNRELAKTNPGISYHNSEVNSCTSCKLLGITVNNRLSWGDHIENVIKKCNTYLYILSRIKLFLSNDNRKRFYNAYILPHFDFCCVIWGNCTSTLEDKLVKLQKRAARVILDCDFTTPSSLMFADLKWMTFPERVIYQKAIQMFKTLHGHAPDYLRTSFTFTSEIHARLLRSSTPFQLYTPKPNLEIYRNTFIFSGSSIWNSLPSYIQNSTSVQHFKSQYLRWMNQS